ncbi:hypothetical protein [Crossiella sp. CA198]|uniref:hypothetical protein n=1 Tax=Crossiella sp. CA198 TaxID=3455607 RepID=UPI003F8D5B22
MPEPVLADVAAALATGGYAGLYELVKVRFEVDRKASRALAAAGGAAEDSPRVLELTAALARIVAVDPEFRERLRGEWDKVDVSQHAETGGVVNHISGKVTGNVVQARDIHGDIRF